MTRITVICNDSDYFLRHRLHVVERLAATGADVTVITGGKPMAKPSAGWRYEHMPIERFSFHPILDTKVMRRSLRHFRTEKPDAVHLITLKPAVLSGLAAVLARKFGGGPRRILITIPGRRGDPREGSRRPMWGIGRAGRQSRRPPPGNPARLFYSAGRPFRMPNGMWGDRWAG